MQPSANVILQTKLRRPPLSAGLLTRPRLLARLDGITACTLTLVTAPAGWGKTSLVCQWLEARGLPAAWLQLDAGDGDPSLFFSYLVYALRQLEPQFGAETEILLRSAAPPPAVLANALSNELDQMQRAAPCLLVLDDYHLVQNSEIDRALARLLQRPPRDFHLIVLSRQPPAWSLGRLRLQDRLLEVGVTDLRFTREEIATYLDRSAGLALPGDMLARLQKQTEGWAAGLQLTALALRQQHDAQALLGEEGGCPALWAATTAICSNTWWTRCWQTCPPVCSILCTPRLFASISTSSFARCWPAWIGRRRAAICARCKKPIFGPLVRRWW